jgi:vancomycin resistance protein YoaR
MHRLVTRVRRLLRVVAYGLAGLTSLLLLTTVGERLMWRGKVLPGVQLIGASVGGRPVGAASDAIDAAAARLEQEPLAVSAGDLALELDPREIGLRVHPTHTLDSVASAGRSGNLLAQVVGTAMRLGRPDEVRWSAQWDTARFRALLDGWEREVASEAVSGTLRFSGARVVPVAPRPGRVLDRPAADRALAEVLRAGKREGVTLPVRTQRPRITRADVEEAAERARTLLATPVTVQIRTVSVTIPPATLGGMLTARQDGTDLTLDVERDALRDALGERAGALEHEPAGARFVVEGSRVRIQAHVTGTTLDLDQIAQGILRGDRIVRGRLSEEEPERTTDDLEGLGIKELVSSFVTHFPAGQPRVKNIQRACAIVNDTTISSGQDFSLNEKIGRRTPDNGFVKAPVIYAGEFTEDFGGGVSQFATTFFNAVFFGGYPILEHQAHTIYISRYPMGREATLSWPDPDLRFRNDTSTAILVRCGVGASSVTVNFYGTKTRTVRAEGPELISMIPIPEEIKTDLAIPRGTQNVEDPGSEGRVVRVTRVITRDGEEIGRKAYVTRYRAGKRIIVINPCDHPDELQRPPEEVCAQTTTTTTEPPLPDEPTTTTVPPEET